MGIELSVSEVPLFSVLGNERSFVPKYLLKKDLLDNILESSRGSNLSKKEIATLKNLAQNLELVIKKQSISDSETKKAT